MVNRGYLEPGDTRNRKKVEAGAQKLWRQVAREV